MDDEPLEVRWEALEACVRGWWEGDLRSALEGDIRRDETGTLLYLPFPYSTAGGSEAAFPEMYAWDTFFINLGLLTHGRYDLVKHHLLNHLFMVERYGFVLNGNRSYYLTRSQAPLLSEGVWRYHRYQPDRDLLMRAYPLLKREYEGYWCAPHHATPVGLTTNRDLGDPNYRPEIAAEAEVLDFTPIFGGDVRACVPLLTNCALVRYERALANIAAELRRHDEAEGWGARAHARAERIRTLCWDETEGFFFEYNYVRGERLPFWSLCAYWALWAAVATPAQAERLVKNLPRFETPFGLTFTDRRYPSPHPEYSSLQWQHPAGWPPMHLIAVEGLDRYGYADEAARISRKFASLMVTTFEKTGKLWEKYNLATGDLEFAVERYETPPMHGWSAAAIALLGRRAFKRGKAR